MSFVDSNFDAKLEGNPSFSLHQVEDIGIIEGKPNLLAPKVAQQSKTDRKLEVNEVSVDASGSDEAASTSASRSTASN